MKKLVGLFLLALLAGCGTPSNGGVPLPAFEPVAPTPGPTIAPPPTPIVVGDPTGLSIPSLDIQSDLIPTGIEENGRLEVPPVEQPMQASWYEGFPEPGEAGRPAVILGHVDGGGQKGVFYNLRKIQVGEIVNVDNMKFRVYKVEIYPKNEFPTEEVYTPNERPELRLITCGGTFGGDRAGHYDDNVVVYAYLASRQ